MTVPMAKKTKNMIKKDINTPNTAASNSLKKVIY
jgi:hypothetical protein